MSKAKQLREALPTSAPGITGEDLAVKANISGKALSGTLYPFLQRGEVKVTEGKDDAPDRFYLNAGYQARKGGGKKKRKAKKAAAKKPARKVARKPRAAAPPSPPTSSSPTAAELVLRHVGTTFAAMELAMPLADTLAPAYRAHREAVQMLLGESA